MKTNIVIDNSLWQNAGYRVMSQNAVGQSICRIL